MKTLFSHSSVNRFQLLSLSVVILATAAIFIRFIRHLSVYNEMHLFAAHQYSDWLVTAAVSILAAAALLITIHSFYKSRKNLLIKNAAMQQAEEKLRESNEWLQAIFDASRDGIVIEDGSEIVYVNKAFAQLLGYKEPEEVIGKDASEVLPPDEAERLAEYGRRRLRGEYAPTLYECKVKHKDGTLIEMEGSVSTAVIGGKKYITTANRDITGRKRAEELIRQSEEKYRTILETIEEGYFETDLEGSFTFYNKALGDVLGYDTDELLGMHYRHYVDRRNAKKLFISYVKVYRTGQPVSELNWEATRKDGTRRFLECSITLIRNAAGEPGGFRGLVRDVTRRKRTEDTLRESESLLAAAQRITHLGSWELILTDLENLNNNEVRWSDETYRIFGYEPGNIRVSNEVFYNAVHPDDRTRINKALIEAIKQEKVFNIEHRIVFPDGNERILHGQAELIFDKRTGKPTKLLGTVQDITERKRANAALRESENKFRMLIENTSEGLLQVDTDDRAQFINNRFCEMVGYSADELINKNWTQILLDDEGRDLIAQANERRRKGVTDRYELKLRKKCGEILWVIVGGAPILDAEGVISGSLGVFTDITERKRAEEQLLHDAFHDGLTGLANRALFMDHLRLTIERGKSRHSNSYAVLFLDFDRFKVVNDSLGHAEGDNLLKYIAQRLESSVRTGDLVARLGGDEFVILLNEMLEEDDAVQIAERIHNNLKKPFNLSGSEVFVSVSIGIALSTAGHKRAEDMLRDADIAMYRAKAKGRAQYQIFDQAMHEDASRQLSLETEMRRALKRREFLIHYQPIINLETETLMGFEALVRWKHPTRGMLPPFEFIPAAEENGLILPLGNWILQESCRQLRQWQRENPALSHLTVSVNLSSKQFSQPDLAEQIAAAIAAAELDPRCLKLEITESHIMENTETAVTMMNRLRGLGVELSLDDFGTGYSSLSYLHRLPVSYLKIDRSFVSRMIENDENGEVVFTIIRLAQNLKMKVVAEGIETAEQLYYLRNLNCEYGQGYFFSKPLEANDASIFIDENIKNADYNSNSKIINLEMNM